MNKVILIGNIGQDPECRVFESGAKNAQFSLATSKRWKDKAGEKKTETAWHNIVLWGNLAEIAEKYLKKGQKVMIEGELKYETYQSDGVTKYITRIIGNNLEMLGSKNEDGPKRQKDEALKTTPPENINPVPDEFEETDGLPF
jgi:single-strand DNA-binding protein